MKPIVSRLSVLILRSKPLPTGRRLASRRMAACTTVARSHPSRRIARAMLLIRKRKKWARSRGSGGGPPLPALRGERVGVRGCIREFDSRRVPLTRIAPDDASHRRAQSDLSPPYAASLRRAGRGGTERSALSCAVGRPRRWRTQDEVRGGCRYDKDFGNAELVQ